MIIKLVPYKSIEDLPIWNFRKINETGDLKYLFKAKDYNRFMIYRRWGLSEIYNNIAYQLLDAFGQDRILEDYEQAKNEFMEMFWTYQAEIAQAQLDERLPDRTLETHLSIKDREVQQISKYFSKFDSKFFNEVEAIATHRGVHLDPKKISVIQWYAYLKRAEKDSIKAKTKQLRK